MWKVPRMGLIVVRLGAIANREVRPSRNLPQGLKEKRQGLGYGLALTCLHSHKEASKMSCTQILLLNPGPVLLPSLLWSGFAPTCQGLNLLPTP